MCCLPSVPTALPHPTTLNTGEAVSPMPEILLTLRPAGWTRHARCTPADYDRLAPIVGGAPTPTEREVRTTAAQELCAHCPVAWACAAAADRRAEVGVWGGALRYRAGGDPGIYTVEELVSLGISTENDRTHDSARSLIYG